MNSAEPHFICVQQSCDAKRLPPLVHGHCVETVVHVLRQVELVTQVDLLKYSPDRHAKGADYVPEAKKSNARVVFDHLPGADAADSGVLYLVGEIQRQRGAATEAHDIDGLVARCKILAQLVVGLSHPLEGSRARAASNCPAHFALPCAGTGHIPFLLTVSLEKIRYVGLVLP